MPYKNCERCCQSFYVRPSTIKQGFGKFCSRGCAAAVINPTRGRRLTLENEQRIVQAYVDGASLNQAGLEFGYGRGGVRCILNRNGIKPRTVSEALKNRPMTPEWRAAIARNHYDCNGQNNPAWKGGVTEAKKPRKAAMSRKEYKNWRRLVFERDCHTCQKCQLPSEELHAHHLKPWNNHPELRYDISNGVTLCDKCHLKIPKSTQKSL